MPSRAEDSMAGTVRSSSMAERARLAKAPQPEPALKCPRCDSTNTKFCYFNNYSLSQPRHFCKTCRRYWTRGGALRNVPVGGGFRRNKRSKSNTSKTSAAERPPVTSAAMAISAGGGGVGAIIPSISAPPQLPFMGSFNCLSDYGTPNIGMTYGGMQTIDPGHFHVGSSSAGISGLEQWRLQQVQQFPFFTGMDQNSPAPTSLGLYQFDSEGGVDATSFTGQIHGKPSASGLISQLASVKMEESSQDRLNLPKQYLGMNPSSDQYWNTAVSGRGGIGGGSTVGGTGWTDLSGSACGLAQVALHGTREDYT